MGREFQKPGATTGVESDPGTARGVPGKTTLVQQAGYGEGIEGDFDLGTSPAADEHGAFGHEREDALEAGDKPGAKVFTSQRFVGSPTLEQVAAGKTVLKTGSNGTTVTRVEQALSDLGHLPKDQVDGKFDKKTEEALTKFSGTKVVDAATLKALDAKFADHTVDASIGKRTTSPTAPTENSEFATPPPELLKDTRKLSATEKKDAIEALAPMAEKDASGKPIVFGENAGKGAYPDRLRSVINQVVTNQFDRMAKGKAAEHADPKNLHKMTDVEAGAKAAKNAVDGVFGGYAVGKAFTAAANLRDRWDVQSKAIADLEKDKKAGGAVGKTAEGELAEIATWRVQKILNESKAVATLNGEHGALVSRAAEKAHVDAVRTEIAGKRQAELLEIHKGWGGSADPNTHEVFLQLFKSPDAAKNREFMWDTFQTMIHEYIHTLNHSKFRTMSSNMKDKAKGHALREGMTDYLTKVAWATVPQGDATLRKNIEGPYHDPGVVAPIPALGTYAAANDAEQMVGIVGAPNAYAAYFLGEVELIGG